MIPILNVLWGIVAGERYHYKDTRMSKFFNMMVTSMRTPLAEPNATWFFPILAKLFPSLEMKVDHFSGEPGDVKHFLNQTIQAHRDTFDDNNIRDFIDAYLVEIKVINRGMIISKDEAITKLRLSLQNAKPGSSFHESQGYEQLVNVLIDLFIAGSDTTSLTLTFGILFLTK